MADIRRRAGAYSDPSLGVAFESLADVFAPPSGQSLYGYAHAAAKRQEMQMLGDLWANRNSMTPQEFDRATAATGRNPVTQGYAKLDVDKRGQDIASGDHRYNTDTVASTSVANNVRDNERALVNQIMTAIPEGGTVVRPPAIASRLGVPETSTGVVKLSQGQSATMPGGPTLQGNAKPLTDSELKAQIMAKEVEKDPALGSAIAQSGIPNRNVYGTDGGTAVLDPVTSEMRNTQTQQAVPPGTKATNLGAPQTTVNVGPNNEPVGNPPPNMAWKRTPDGKVAFDERGIPIALPITNSPLADKRADADKKQGAAAQSRATAGGIVTQDIDRAISAIETDPALTSGVGAQITGGIGGTPARNVKGLLDSVRANVGFDRLQQMRAESPTGGALGQVSNKEMELLQSVLGSLDQAQGGDQLTANLKRVKDITLDIVHGPGHGPARTNEQTATNRQTGERQIYRGGAWVPHND